MLSLVKRGENMSKHHHSNQSQGQNKSSSGGIGKLLGNIDINQVTSLLSSVDINQISSLISKFGKGSKSEPKVNAIPVSTPLYNTLNNTPNNGATTLNGLHKLGVLKKEELDLVISRISEQLQPQRSEDNEPDFNQEEGVNELSETINKLLGNIDTNELLNLIRKLNLKKEEDVE